MFLGVDHVGVAVPDLDAAVRWYRDMLGFRVVHEESNDEQGVREAMLSVGAGGGAEIQLLAPLTSDSVIARFLVRAGAGVQHVAYAVDDLDAECARLRAGGVQVLWERARRGTRGSRINFVHPADAGGVLVELVQQARHEPATGPASTGSDGADRGRIEL